MNLKPIFSDSVSSNTYLIEDEKNVLIDAGMNENILMKIPRIDILINTHCHFDHIGANKAIQEKFGCEIWMGKEEVEFFEKSPRESSAAEFFSFDTSLDFKINRKLGDKEVLDLGETQLEVLLTPGHTPGSICLYDEKNKYLFSGDTLFTQGFGRYDLPGGSVEQLKRSLKELSKLEIKELFPGHGPRGLAPMVSENLGNALTFL